jgi:hypothetical protein
MTGISTTSISLVREHTETLKPPRALWVPFPFGHAFGRPNDPEIRHRVLRAALGLLDEPSGPVLRDLSGDQEPGDQPAAPTQASAVTPAEHVPIDAAMETLQMRRYHGRWLEASGRTAGGLSGVPPTRFRGIVRFLEGFADGQEVEHEERPSNLPLPDFIRYCADDMKALYYEGYMALKPAAGGDEIARWFWGETAIGQVLRRVRDRLDASDDPRWKAAAFGVAR